MSEWRPHHEEDRIDRRLLAAITAGSVSALALSLVVSWLWSRPRPPLGSAQPMAPTLVHRPWSDRLPATLRRIERRRHLESAGWVDREAGVVHVPVDLMAQWALEDGAVTP